MRGAAAVREASRFFRALYGPEAPGILVLFTIPGFRAHAFSGDQFEEAAQAAVKLAQTHDVYHGIGLQKHAPQGTQRGDAAGVEALPGYWLDLDLRTPYRNRSDIPGTAAEAVTFLDALPLAPSGIVLSGGGLYPWWTFREPWTLETEEERGEAARLSRGWQSYVLATAKKRHGWTLDSTPDLARILRVPGTLNHKTDPPAPVRVLRGAGPRYVPDEFEGFVVEEEPKPPALNPAQPPIEAGTPRRRAYVVAAIEAECLELASLHPDCERRNTTLNRAAFSLARFVATGEADPERLADLLAFAARNCGLGDRESERTIVSAFGARGVAV